ncbi:hypothetical protein PPYR_13372 [Photinus pyralis]|uniref:Adenosine kinase n=1 Tax=Photinus pyralis TaxID=7054 RepID=A0A1Y1LM30_PHOPY|nr:adenosine kinase [Photinus pyralis]KAB0793752.1 hypothetical protein PPYR_13372 [Photinus pyralis]
MEHSTLRKGMLLGIGNPLLDVSANVEKDVLDKYDMIPNNAILAADIHKPLCGELIQKYSAQFIAGGSVQNSLRVAQWILDEPNVTTFFGCVGDDEYAKILEKYARSNGVNVKYQCNKNEPTGTCAVLITDKHRSLCADLGAANTFTIDHIRNPENWSCIENANMYYISGFFLTVSPPTALEVANYALSKNRPFIMNLSAPFISEFFAEPLMELLPFIDILLGNESEAEMFASVQNFGTKDLKKIALKVCELPKKNPNRSRVCIITQGPDAVILAQNGTITEFPVEHVPEDKVVDTNGAGDAFVGGFLGQLTMGKPLDVCIKCGIWTAREIIQKSGCTFEGKANFNV